MPTSLTRTRLLITLVVLGGCATVPGAAPNHPAIDPFLGVYQGSFESALTEDPADDLNHGLCALSAEPGCDYGEPLADVLLELRRDPRGNVRLAWFRNQQDLEAGRELDLLGRGCGTRLGALETLDSAGGQTDRAWLATFPLAAENRACLGRLRPTSQHHVRVRLRPGDRPGDATGAQVVIDRAVRDTNYLYVVEDGVRRRVRVDLDNTIEADTMTRYRVCIENDLGEFERCVRTDREFRSFGLPVPVPGGAAVSYAWWQELSPRLRRTRGRYELEQYVGRFERIAP